MCLDLLTLDYDGHVIHVSLDKRNFKFTHKQLPLTQIYIK